MTQRPALFIGTAGWRMPKVGDTRNEGSVLEAYAAHFNGVEVNSTHYKHHMERTYLRWAASVPKSFRFGVKMHRDITHVQRLTQVGPIQEFLCEVSALGDKLGPVLIQLPPKLSWSEAHGDVLEAVREVYGGSIVLEPRHPSWADSAVLGRLKRIRIGVVAADPPLIVPAVEPLGEPSLAYFRLHGNPRMYWSPYDEAALRSVAEKAQAWFEKDHQVWIMFDNTASGEAAPNALRLKKMIGIVEGQ